MAPKAAKAKAKQQSDGAPVAKPKGLAAIDEEAGHNMHFRAPDSALRSGQPAPHDSGWVLRPMLLREVTQLTQGLAIAVGPSAALDRAGLGRLGSQWRSSGPVPCGSLCWEGVRSTVVEGALNPDDHAETGPVGRRGIDVWIICG